MNMADRIRERRIIMGYTQEELAEKLGLQKSAIAKYEKGRVENIKRSNIEKMAAVLDCKPSYLMGWDEAEAPKDEARGVWIPVLGSVPAGIPLEAIEDIIDWEEIPRAMAAGGEFFSLAIKGDSMIPKLEQGDVVIVRKQPDAETGDIVVARVNGDDATCKRLVKHEDSIVLQPLNPSYMPLVFSAREIEEKPVVILGKVVEIRRKV